MTGGQGQVDQTGTPSYVDDDEPRQSKRKVRAVGRAHGVGGALSPQNGRKPRACTSGHGAAGITNV